MVETKWETTEKLKESKQWHVEQHWGFIFVIITIPPNGEKGQGE